MIMTVTLGQGAMRMAKEKVIVKRLEAIENLGNMDILCSDKTGTLTLGAVNLQAHVDVAGGGSRAGREGAWFNCIPGTGVRSWVDGGMPAHAHSDLAGHYETIGLA